jgi:hypothetical protein
LRVVEFHVPAENGFLESENKDDILNHLYDLFLKRRKKGEKGTLQKTRKKVPEQ